MAILILKILGLWSLVATCLGFTLGAAIHRADQARRDVFLSCALASLEALEAYHGYAGELPFRADLI